MIPIGSIRSVWVVDPTHLLEIRTQTHISMSTITHCCSAAAGWCERNREMERAT